MNNKRFYYAFTGQLKTITGRPHLKTGKHNVYGEITQFSSLKRRNDFCKEFNTQYQAYPVATNRQDAKRKYFAGYTQEQFEEEIAYCEHVFDYRYHDKTY